MKTQRLHTIVWKENRLFVAKFLELELASQGKTKEEAIINLKEALDLYLEDEDVSSLKLPYFILAKKLSKPSFVQDFMLFQLKEAM